MSEYLELFELSENSEYSEYWENSELSENSEFSENKNRTIDLLTAWRRSKSAARKMSIIQKSCFGIRTFGL